MPEYHTSTTCGRCCRTALTALGRLANGRAETRGEREAVVAGGSVLGSRRRLGLWRGFSLQVAKGVDTQAQKENDDGEVGFGFGNGYDFGAAAREALFEGVSNEAIAIIAVEADAVEVGIESGVIREDDMAVVGTVSRGCAVLVDAIPVPDGQVGAVGPGSYSAEAQCVDEAGEVDDRVGAEGEKPYAFVEGSTYGHATAAEIDSSGVVDGVFCCDEEGTAVDIDDRAVGEGASVGGFEGSTGNRGSAVAVFHEVAGARNAAAVGGA